MRKRIRYAVLAIAVLVGLPVALGLGYALRDLPLKSSPLQFSIKPGSSLRSAAQEMVDAGVLDAARPFELLVRLAGEPTSIKAGNYEIEQGLTPLELMNTITRGSYTALAITFVEGWTFRQVRQALNEHPGLRHDTQALTEAEILQRLGIAHPSGEGLFFPDTYHFSHGVSDLNVLRRAHQLMEKHLAAQWARRAPDLPLANPYEALILASIVEKETGQASERALISGVFVNRLRIGMRLQTDPTVIYGLGERFDGNLRKKDLITDNPYNTYTRGGMPPTPIAMPGLASLHAALNPGETNALYFVARGDGTSYFSRHLDEHERAVTKYQRSGRRNAR